MAEVDIAPNFGLELKVLAQHIFLLTQERTANYEASGWLQVSQRMGIGWHRLARRYTAVLPGTKCNRERIQRKAQWTGKEVLREEGKKV